MRKPLFIIIVCVGIAPLALNTLLLMGGSAGDEIQVPVLMIAVLSVGLLAILAAVAASWLSRSMSDDMDRLRGALDSVSTSGFRGWVRERGSHLETRELGSALNRLIGNVAAEETDLQREEAESRAVATQSLEFIEELLRARVPLAKHHPGLIESYSRELIARKRSMKEGESSQRFVRGVMDAVLGRDRENVRRGYPRYLTRTLWTESPVTARIIDLSESGMCIESLDPPQTTNTESFEIFDGHQRLSVSGRVQWCRLVSTNRVLEGEAVTVYRAGVAFEGALSPRQHERLLSALDGQLGRQATAES